MRCYCCIWYLCPINIPLPTLSVMFCYPYCLLRPTGSVSTDRPFVTTVVVSHTRTLTYTCLLTTQLLCFIPIYFIIFPLYGISLISVALLIFWNACPVFTEFVATNSKKRYVKWFRIVYKITARQNLLYKYPQQTNKKVESLWKPFIVKSFCRQHK